MCTVKSEFAAVAVVLSGASRLLPADGSASASGFDGMTAALDWENVREGSVGDFTKTSPCR